MLQCRNVIGNMLFITNPLGVLLLWIIFIHLVHNTIEINVKQYTKSKTHPDDDSTAAANATTTATTEVVADAATDNDDENKTFVENENKNEKSTMQVHSTSTETAENEINRNAKNGKHLATNVLSTMSTIININLTRQHDGDLFTANGLTSCNADMCIGLSSGTGFWQSDKTNESGHKNEHLYRSTLNHDEMINESVTNESGDAKYRKNLLNNQKVRQATAKALTSSSLSSLPSLSPLPISDVLLSSLPSSMPLPMPLPLPLSIKDINNDNNNNNMNSESCQCRCLPYLNTYREDLGICVDDIHECSVSPFVSGSSSEKIPLVFLPLKGQIIYPSREIRFPDILKPVCVVTGAQYLTANGWTDLRNPIDTNYPFRIFRDEGHTFIQWLGEADLRHKIQGRLIVVHLVCRDMTLSLNASISSSLNAHSIARNVFSPCVAFRINGSPINYTNNVSEVLFQSETSSTKATTSDGIMTFREYVVIGICTLVLVLIYVSSVFLYLHMKKRKNHNANVMRNVLDDFTNEINYPKNDQVTFGVPFTRSGSLYSAGSLGNAITNEPRSRTSLNSLKDDIGIVKNNPLLQHFPQLNENHSGFSSDISNSASECEMDNNAVNCSGNVGNNGLSIGIASNTNLNGSNIYHDRKKQIETNALIHSQINYHHHHPQQHLQSHQQSNQIHHIKGRTTHQTVEESEHLECSSSSTEEKECLPTENVAIIEDIISEEKIENLRSLVNGNIRKKLYFNPSYFEPHLLAEPPPAALEFLQKIREVISIAKYKMATKRYQPSLNVIPEEGAMAHSNAPSPFNSQMQTVADCHGCINTNNSNGHLKNCGEKRNSIEKWLQTVHSTEEDTGTESEIETEVEMAVELEAELDTDIQGEVYHNENAQELERCIGPVQKNVKTLSNNLRIAETSKHLNNNTNKPNTLLVSLGQKKIGRKELIAPKQKPPLPPSNKSSNTNNKLKLISSPSLSTSCPSMIATMTGTATNAITKEPSCQNVSMYEACSIPQMLPQIISHNNKLDDLTALTKAASIYGYAETGSEIYNNPKFSLQDSPTTSQRSHESSQKSKQRQTLHKHFELLDAAHRATVNSIASTTTTTTIPNVPIYGEHMPYYDIAQLFTLDNNKEKAINNGLEYSSTLHSNNSFHLNIPTPDYDSTMEKKNKDIYNNSSSGPSVPTPDYSSLSRKSLKQYQPDSPIYRRKSPQYLIVDYETDSLERSVERTKEKVSSQSSSSPSSDVSSQLSPSLSTALPMEEELEITHTVFGDRCNSKNITKLGKKSTAAISKAKTSETVDTNMTNKVKIARIKYDTPFQGSMTIEVEHEPPSDLERSTDSDQYEPDTLDRKPKKQTFCDISHWPTTKDSQQDEWESERLNMNSVIPSNNYETYDTSARVPSDSLLQNDEKHTVLNIEPASLKNLSKMFSEQSENVDFKTYQTLLIRQNSDYNCNYDEKDNNNAHLDNNSIKERGRILTLEAKHSRRQRLSESHTPPPPEVEISNYGLNRTTIRISTNKGHNFEKKSKCSESKCAIDLEIKNEKNSHTQESFTLERTIDKKSNYRTHEEDVTPTPSPITTPPPTTTTTPTSTPSIKRKNSAPLSNKQSGVTPTSSISTTLSNCRATGKLRHITPNKYLLCSNGEDETHKYNDYTEIIGIPDTIKNSEIKNTMEKNMSIINSTFHNHNNYDNDNSNNLLNKCSTNIRNFEKSMMNKLINDNYASIFNTHINGLRSDYSLNKYMIRRKEKINDNNKGNGNENANDYQIQNNTIKDNENYDVGHEIKQVTNTQQEDNNILRSSSFDLDFNRVDSISLSSRSNRSSSRLTQRTTEMYRNAGVPVGIAYPQRNNTNNSNNSNNNTIATTPTVTTNSARGSTAVAAATTTNVHNVYRCEIEPVQLTHGMQIAMGLKDRPPKKSKDLRNAWKKFVSIAASKFNPTSYDKNSSRLLDVLAKATNEAANVNVITPSGSIGQLQQQHSIFVTGDSCLETSSSSPLIVTNQDYYEQRFGVGARSIQDPESGYLSTDSIEVLKRGHYDRYNYRLIYNRERIITVDTIEDNSDSDAPSNFEENSHLNMPKNRLCNDGGRQYNGVNLADQYQNAFYKELGNEEQVRQEISEEDRAKINREENESQLYDEMSDNDSDKTITYSNSMMVAPTTATSTIKMTMTTPNHQSQRKSSYTSDSEDDNENNEDDNEDNNDDVDIENVDDNDDDGRITTPTTTPSNISSETDDEINAEDTWESGAESIETHSVLYKNIRKQLQRV